MAETGFRSGKGIEKATVRRKERATGTNMGLEPRTRTTRGHLAWVGLFGLVGFLVPAVFVGGFQLPRAWYLIVYFAAIGTLGYGYFRWTGVDFAQLVRKHWIGGLAVGAVVSVFTVNTILIQPSSPAPQGAELAFDLTWLGVLYGTADAFLLSIVPVHAAWRAFEGRGWTTRWRGRLAVGALAVLASMFVILVYHLGYPECRGPQVAQIVVGVALQSVGYLIARSPLAPVVSHVAMHIAAVLYGLNTVVQLPPHY